MIIKEFKKDFFTIEEFLDEKTCKSIVSYFNFLVDNNILKWNEISFYGSQAMGYWPSDNNLKIFDLDPNFFSQLKQKIKEKVEEVLGIEVNEISYHAQRWIEGAFADYHSDNSDEDGKPTAFERSKYAAFLYLNDDFDGGLLKMKNYPIVVEPKIGLLAVFAGGHTNEHLVTTIENGKRYTVGSFWDDASCVYTDEQRKAWDDELKQVRAEQEKIYKLWATPEGKPIAPKR
jgi:hypothetical protein